MEKAVIRIRSGGPPRMRQRYEQAIRGVLAVCGRSATGALLLNTLRNHRRNIIIEPYTDAGANNAEAVPFSEDAAGTFGTDRTAAGTHSIVRFSVERSVMPPHWPQGQSDEVMIHELAHALRQVTGTERYANEPMNANNPVNDGFLNMASYGNVEEFFASMVASVHSSELNRRALANHGGMPLRDPQLLNQQPFTTRMNEIRSRPPLQEFCRQMAAIHADFNPFRDL